MRRLVDCSREEGGCRVVEGRVRRLQDFRREEGEVEEL